MALILGTTSILAQGAKNIQINEVMTNNTASLQDEFGNREAWIELANKSYSTYNVRGMYVTTNKNVLSAKSVAKRIEMMSMIPNEDERTNLTARKHLLLFCNSNPADGAMHLKAKIDSSKTVWVALYDGNAVDLIDSVTVPVLAANTSIARINDGNTWEIKSKEEVTPGITNSIKAKESKVTKIKREDPYGIGITIMSMCIVFFCLALLYAFFRLFGMYMEHKQNKKDYFDDSSNFKSRSKNVDKNKTSISIKDSTNTNEIDNKTLIAVIAMALADYQDCVHDAESGVITIRQKRTNWNNLVRSITIIK
jgi:Na+-transporting methylmalonyl-CoA/oxaloacetate decarboxylase gamma subunit